MWLHSVPLFCSVFDAISAAAVLTLTAVTDHVPRQWPMGSTVFLEYEVETSSDAVVFCTVGDRRLSAQLFSVPPRRLVRRARGTLELEGVSNVHVGDYICHARAANLSESLTWMVRSKTPEPCKATGVCHEATGSPCPWCGCPVGKMFYGKNRTFRCFDTHTGLSLRVAKVKDGYYMLHDRQWTVIDYELTTFGDTQVTCGIACRVPFA